MREFGHNFGTAARACGLVLGLAAGMFLAGAVLQPGGVMAAERSPAPKNARVYIIWPGNGRTVKGSFWLRMGAKSVGLAPAGVKYPNTGHHHLVIDKELPPFDEEIPNDKNHLHFGGGQSEVRIELPPGKHTLQLLLGDHNHVPHDPPVMSEKITITVK